MYLFWRIFSNSPNFHRLYPSITLHCMVLRIVKQKSRVSLLLLYRQWNLAQMWFKIAYINDSMLSSINLGACIICCISLCQWWSLAIPQLLHMCLLIATYLKPDFIRMTYAINLNYFSKLLKIYWIANISLIIAYLVHG